MCTAANNSSFLSNTLKRRQQKKYDANKLLQEGISSLHLSITPNEQHQQHVPQPKGHEGIYPLLNIDPESYLLDEGDERSMLEPSSLHNSDFKQTINVLFNWINSSLSKDLIIVRSFEDDLYDGYVLGKLIEFYQPNVRLLPEGIPISEESKKKTLHDVLSYLETCFVKQNKMIKWTFEQIYNRNFIAILNLLLALVKYLNIKINEDLPKTLLLKVIVVKKLNGLLHTKIIHECFIDEHEKDSSTIVISKKGDLIDTLFDLSPEKLNEVETVLLNFLNNNLNRYNIHIKQIDTQHFQDGLNILYLISHLENYFLILNKYHHKKPITREQSHSNFQLAFQLLNQAGIDIENYCRINDILSGNQRSLYRLLLQLYLHYNTDANNLFKCFAPIQRVHTSADSQFL